MSSSTSEISDDEYNTDVKYFDYICHVKAMQHIYISDTIRTCLRIILCGLQVVDTYLSI